MTGTYLIQFLNGLSDAASLFLVSAGLSLIFGVSRVVNMAHGSFYMIGAYLAYYIISLLPKNGLLFCLGIFLSSISVGLVGVILETVILRRLYKAPELFILMATFSVVLIIQDLSLWIFGAEDLLGPKMPGMDGSIKILGSYIPQYNLFLIAVAFMILFLLWFLLNKTRWGLFIRAATEDREMLSGLGVNEKWLFTGAFFLGSTLAGLGGAVQLPVGGADLMMDLNVIAEAFVVVVVGGMGSIGGAFLASLLIGELTSFGILIIPQSTLVMTFFIMAVVLILRPYGLFGRAQIHRRLMEEIEDPPLIPPSKRVKATTCIVLLLIFIIPIFFRGFQLVLLSEIAIFSLACMSLYFMMGPGGMISFGHAAFFGGGAYSAALLVHYLHLPMELTLLLSPIFIFLLASIIGWFCVRLSGVYLAMLTLAFSQILWAAVKQWKFLGGDDGILGIWPSKWASNEVTFYYLTMIVSISGILCLRYLLFTPFGYGMRGCRDSPLMAEAIGINIKMHQWLSFSISGMFAGLAGALYAFSKGSVFPYEISIFRSFDILLSVLLGGMHSISGPIVGAGTFIWLEDMISRFHFWRLILGLIFLLLVIGFPKGISGVINKKLFRFFHPQTEIN
ncbi:MAG TPA: ABC transporter permease [Desulfobacteraceae bacterium]|nr:ABC transporter permease [Desulfobacteraceae bacterium]